MVREVGKLRTLSKICIQQHQQNEQPDRERRRTVSSELVGSPTIGGTECVIELKGAQGKIACAVERNWHVNLAVGSAAGGGHRFAILQNRERRARGRSVHESDSHLRVSGVNPFDYLKQLERHKRRVTREPVRAHGLELPGRSGTVGCQSRFLLE